MNTTREILILGGGYAGVAVTRGLRGIDATVTLVNEHSYHQLTTLLHQPIAGQANYRDLSVDLREVLPASVKFIRGKAQAIHPDSREVRIHTRQGETVLTPDILVIALGWQTQFYNIPGLQEHALTLQNLNSSRLARDRIEEALIAYDENPDETWRRDIVIGGSGLTGVELAGELADGRAHLAALYDLAPDDISITVVDGQSQILHGLDPWLAQETARRLQARGVKFVLGQTVEAVTDREVRLKGGMSLPAGTIIWAGGVRGNALLEQSGFAVNRQGRATVDNHLHPGENQAVFIVGDCAAVCNAQGTALPPTAQLAIDQGQWVARCVRASLKQQACAPYVPHEMGLVLSVGRKQGVGLILGHRISGVPAGMAKDAIAYHYLFQASP